VRGKKWSVICVNIGPIAFCNGGSGGRVLWVGRLRINEEAVWFFFCSGCFRGVRRVGLRIPRVFFCVGAKPCVGMLSSGKKALLLCLGDEVSVV